MEDDCHHRKTAHRHCSVDGVSKLIRVAKCLTVLDAVLEALSIETYKIYQDLHHETIGPNSQVKSVCHRKSGKHRTLPLDYSYCFRSTQYQMTEMSRQQQAQRPPVQTILLSAEHTLLNQKWRVAHPKLKVMDLQIITF